MEREFEIIRGTQIPHLRLFVNELDYRISHLHREFELLYALKNPVKVTFFSKVHLLEEGQIMLINPSEVHMLEKVEASSIFLCLQISNLFFKENFPQMELLRFPDNLHSISTDKRIRMAMLDIAEAYLHTDDREALHLCAEIYHLFYMLLENGNGRYLTQKEREAEREDIERIDRLLEFIDENYTHKIRLSDLAQKENLSLSYLSHFAKEVLSESFQDYVRSLRFNYALKLLSSRTYSVEEASYASGFSNPRYMVKEFVSRLGIKPSEYMQRIKEDDTEEVKVHISAHSSERYYSRHKSMEIIRETKSKLNI